MKQGLHNYELLNTINHKVVIKDNKCYIYIGNVLGLSKCDCGLFLRITKKLFNNYNGNELYDLLHSFYDENWNAVLVEGIENFNLGEDYFLSESLYKAIYNTEDIDTNITFPNYIDEHLYKNYLYEEKHDIDIEYLYKLNMIYENKFSQGELDNFYSTFCKIILDNVKEIDYSNINNYIYLSVLEYYANGSTNEALQSLKLILQSKVYQTNDMYSSCNSSCNSNSNSNMKSCVDIYIEGIFNYLKQMLGDVNFYHDFFHITIDDTCVYNETIVDNLLLLLEEFNLMNYDLSFGKSTYSKCNCDSLGNNQISSANRDIINNYYNVLLWIKNCKIEENTNKIKIYGTEFAELLPNLQF
jgi:hypothetical protein